MRESTCSLKILPTNVDCEGKLIPMNGQTDLSLEDDESTQQKPNGMEQVPAHLQHKWTEYAKGLLKRHPKMKPQRVRELTARKFNVKLV